MNADRNSGEVSVEVNFRQEYRRKYRQEVPSAELFQVQGEDMNHHCARADAVREAMASFFFDRVWW